MHFLFVYSFVREIFFLFLKYSFALKIFLCSCLVFVRVEIYFCVVINFFLNLDDCPFV